MTALKITNRQTMLRKIFKSMYFVFDRKDENHENLFPSSNVGLDHLRVLYLDDNDLGQVPTESLVPLPHLAELNLGLNNIKEIFTFT